jgi:hypothetical protein
MNFDGELGMLDEVIRNLLWNTYGCRKQFLQQKYSTTKNLKQTTQKMHND